MIGAKKKIDNYRLLLVYKRFMFQEENVREHIRQRAKRPKADVMVRVEVDDKSMRCTYVLVNFNGRFQSSKADKFDIGTTRPEIFVVDSEDTMKKLTRFFVFDEEPQIQQSQPEEGETKTLQSQQGSPGQLATETVIREVVVAPKASLKLYDMNGWQKDFLDFSRAPGRTKRGRHIGFVHVFPRCGRSELMHALKIEASPDIHIVDTFLTADIAERVRKVPIDVWNRDTLIIDVGRVIDPNAYETGAQRAVALYNELGCYVWMFANIPPRQLFLTHRTNPLESVWDKYDMYNLDRAGEVHGSLHRTISGLMQQPK